MDFDNLYYTSLSNNLYVILKWCRAAPPPPRPPEKKNYKNDKHKNKKVELNFQNSLLTKQNTNKHNKTK